jgi:arsenate reductase-like glutaredoxin family protein
VAGVAPAVVPAEPKPAVQIFGYRDSRPTQQAIRFFRERRIGVTFVDLAQRPLARAELQRFTQKFGAIQLLDETSRAYRDAGLSYMRLDEANAFDRLLTDPRMLKLPLVRSGNNLSIGTDESAWRGWLAQP